MKVAQRFSAGKPAHNTIESAKRTIERNGFIAGVFSRPLRGLRNPPRSVPALKHWATFTRSASRTRKIGFCRKPLRKSALTLCRSALRLCRSALRLCRPALSLCKLALTLCNLALTLCNPALTLCKLALTLCKPALTLCNPALTQCKLALSQCKSALSQCKLALSLCNPALSQCKSAKSRRKPDFQGFWAFRRICCLTTAGTSPLISPPS